MDCFIHDLGNQNLDNMTGHSYRELRICLYREGMLLVSRHNTNEYCHIAIASDRTAKCTRGCQNPAAYGKALPQLSRGEWVIVWEDGLWKRGKSEGPWVRKIFGLLDDLIVELALAVRQSEEKTKAAGVQEDNKARTAHNSLVSEWAE